MRSVRETLTHLTRCVREKHKNRGSTGCVRESPDIKIEASAGCVRETPQIKNKPARDV